MIPNILDFALTESNSITPAFGDIRDYNRQMKYCYHRTLRDIVQLDERLKSNGKLRILEIGSFTGVICIALANLGYSVVAHDIPFIVNDHDLARLLRKHGIDRVAVDLQDCQFDLDSASFDVIIFNEVLEHLCFNSIPLLREFNRILSPQGRVYCATPNLACLKNRCFLMKGRGFLSPIAQMQLQLDSEKSTSVGLHWREWTKAELLDLFKVSGFDMEWHRYSPYVENTSSLPRKMFVRWMYRLFPAFMPCQIGLFKKSVGEAV